MKNRLCAPLEGAVVVDLSTELAGRYASYLLGAAGATVFTAPRTDRGVQVMDESTVFHALAECVPTSTFAESELAARLAVADVVIQSAPRPSELPLGIDPPHSASRVICTITPFGLSGPASERSATDFTLQARGGWVHFNGRVGEEPLKSPGNLASSVIGGVTAALSALAYLVGGQNGHLDVSILESIASANRYYDTLWAFTGEVMGRTGSGLSATNRTARCGDGSVAIAVSTQPQWDLLCALMEMDDLLSDASLQTPLDRLAQTERIRARMDEWLVRHDKWSIFHGAQALRVPTGPVLEPREIPKADQLVERRIFSDRDGNPSPLPLRLASYSQCFTPVGHEGPAPSTKVNPAGVPGQPLRGLRVIEVANWWAGPVIGRLLAMLGAEVVKVESPLHPDPWRFLRCITSGEQQHEASPFFSGANIGKKSVGLDSSTTEGAALLLKLAARADVLVENLSPAASDNLGLTGDALRFQSPGLVRTSLSGFGHSGPWRNYVSFAGVGDAIAGVCSGLRYEPDGDPLYQGNQVGDSIAGYHAAFATLGALFAKSHHSGRGQDLDVSQCETLLNLSLEAFVDLHLGGSGSRPVRNDAPGYLMQSCLRTHGNDEWIAVSVRTPADWQALREVFGLPASAECNASERAKVADEAASWSKHELAEALQRAGIPAEPVLSPPEVLADAQLGARSAHEYLNHEVTGIKPYVGLGARDVQAQFRARRPAPLFGADAELVLADWLNMDSEAVAALRQARVLSNHPFNSGLAVGA